MSTVTRFVCAGMTLVVNFKAVCVLLLGKIPTFFFTALLCNETLKLELRRYTVACCDVSREYTGVTL